MKSKHFDIFSILAIAFVSAGPAAIPADYTG